MRRLKIVDTENYALWSYDNGTAYCLVRSSYTCKPEDADDTIFVQGEDAEAFRDLWTGLEDSDPYRPTDEVMAELWRTYFTA